ncbi:hypothetical protein [Streptomyces sp. PT12]|uniref:hypothetical protein n=1 Tax=Streptomyces sp. PT12 TaxID=1510197 RepID=UPI0015EEF013|nr:hypothetical protein [Streptomyces sp. PT12]
MPRLRRASAVGHLLARQAGARAIDADMSTLGRDHPGPPDDLLNFPYGPVTYAIAAEWPGAERPVTVVTRIDGRAFGPLWLDAVEAAATARGARW